MKSTLILILSFFNSIFGQKNFQKGYVVTLSGDTLTGEIDNRDWSKSPAEIRFRKLIEKEIRYFNAYQYRAFGINSGIEYQSFQTALYQTKEEKDISSYEIVADTTVFMEVISKGKLSLYDFVEKGEKSRFFVKKENGNLIQLIYHSVYKGTYLIHNNLYLNQLADLTGAKNIPNIEHQINSLNAFVEKFNRVKIAKKKSVKIQMRFGGTYYQNFTNFRINKGLPSPSRNAEFLASKPNFCGCLYFFEKV